MPVEELRLQKEKCRVFELARELNMSSKDLIDVCHELAIEVKNQLSGLDRAQIEQIEQRVRRGGGVAVAAPARPAGPPVLPRDISTKVRTLPPAKTAQAPPAGRPLAQPPAAPVTPPPAAPQAPAAQVPPAPVKPVEVPVAPAAVKPEPAAPVAPAALKPAAPVAPPAVSAPPPPPQPVAPPPVAPAAEAPKPVETPTARPVEPQPPSQPATLPNLPPKMPTLPTQPAGGARVPSLGAGPRTEGGNRPGGNRPPRQLRPPTVVRAAPPPSLKPRPPAKDAKKPSEPKVMQPLVKFTPEQLERQASGKTVTMDALINQAPPGSPVLPPVIDEEEGEGDGKGKVRAKAVPGRDKRQQARNERAKKRKGGTEVELVGTTVKAIVDDDQQRRPSKHRIKLKKQQPTMPRKGKVPVELPITVRSLSEAIGMKAVELLFKLRDHGINGTNLNITLDPELAETIALEKGFDLEIKRPLDAEEQLLADQDKPDNPEDLVPRAPVVTIMGHVDHGKTSLLDKIRSSNIIATEAGGITQVIRAWRVEHDGKPITFLDTPGHEAFTKMRARGAQVTDIAVIVVAADDGVMPQTEEAINHARAAGVPIVVAINKVDLPNANVEKTRRQLYNLQVLPDNMGGDTPFVETAAPAGKESRGIFEPDGLLDMLSLVAELRELKANPNKPARGTCLEAMLSEGEGVRATLLVRDGTLRRGDVVLCGATYGRVRQMYDDLGRPLQEAGPSMPVQITGLEVVPNADDPFQVVPDLTVAREIAEKRAFKQHEASAIKREPVKLEELTAAKITELKIILKADFRGSIEAIRKELEKLHHEEVRVRILHTGIGAITESDVQLALTSPEDTIIVGFNVVPDDRALALAEERGVQIRDYKIIYNLTDDIRAALEGKLKPREEVVHLGRAVVRETFKISRVGTIAGCYVTQGTIKRSAKVRIIREGVVIYPPPERTASLESLKRFKEDASEVREGFECGLKVAGYDDIKVGDVIEAYRVEQVQRTL
jgi:translation initiation factor IF-2